MGLNGGRRTRSIKYGRTTIVNKKTIFIGNSYCRAICYRYLNKKLIVWFLSNDTLSRITDTKNYFPGKSH